MGVIAATVDEAVAAGRRRRFDEGQFHGVADYLFESLPGAELGPQALVARQAPGWVLPVHFHMQHQFQVVLRGSGTLGKHALEPGSVHYTSPQSGYGPIVAGDDGLDYFTLRVLTGKGAWYLPEARPFMDPGLFKEQQWGSLRGGSGLGWQTLINARNDGLGAWACAGARGKEYLCRAEPSEAGRFYAVIRGTIQIDGKVLCAGSCAYWTSSGPPPPAFLVLDDDVLVIAVQFPHHAVRTHVPPELRIAPSAKGVAVD